jgi:hypothetical protein
MRLEPGTDNWKDACDWIHGETVRGTTPDADAGGPRMVDDGAVEIATLEGVMRADPGDWIIRGVKGEFYPCKPDIFDATYEAVTEANA